MCTCVPVAVETAAVAAVVSCGQPGGSAGVCERTTRRELERIPRYGDSGLLHARTASGFNHIIISSHFNTNLAVRHMYRMEAAGYTHTLALYWYMNLVHM